MKKNKKRVPVKPKPRRRSAPKRRPLVSPGRGHSTVEQQAGLAALIDEWLLAVPRPTYNEMMDRLRGTAYHISRSALARYGYKFEIQRRSIRLLVEKAKLLRASGQDDVLAMEEAVSQLLNTRILESLLGDEDEEGKAKLLSEGEISTIFAASRLQSSSAQRERTRLAVTRGVDRALKILRRELEELLRDDPPLLKRVLEKVEEVRQRQAGGVV